MDYNITYILLLLYKKDDVIFNMQKSTNNIPDNTISEIKLIEKQKESYIRTLDRLSDLYFFSEDSMPKKNYPQKKSELEEKIYNLEIKISEINSSNDTLTSNDDLIDKISNFILTNELLKSDEIDFRNLLDSIDKSLIKDSKLLSIRFKNGLIHTFIYKNQIKTSLK